MKQSALAAYGVLGLPLAMAMLPIYVLVPNFYAADLGLGLALTGSVRSWRACWTPCRTPGSAG